MRHGDLIPEDVWTAMFTPAQLQPFVPPRGQLEDRQPMLEVWYLDAEGRRKNAAILVVIQDFNDQAQRFEAFQAMGARLADEHWKVVALRLICAGWQRRLEGQDFDGVLPVDAPDREEVMLVAGVTIDARCALATAVVLRDKAGRVRAVRPWEVMQQGKGESQFYLLNKVWQGYLVRYAARHGLAPKHPERN